jgi:hypothetical protein
LCLFASAIYYGNKLKYLAVRVNTTINRRTTGYSTGIPIVERWENFIQGQVGDTEEKSLIKGFLSTSEKNF